MFPVNPMMSMPFMGYASQQPTDEQRVQMQQLALQNQQLQLRQMKQMLEQYSQSIDTSLKQVEEQLGRLERGEPVDFPTQAQFPPQVQIQSQGLAQRLLTDTQSQALRFADRFSDPLRADPQNWVIAGMGDFGRPIF